MELEIVTKQDLQEFKSEFLNDLVKIIRPEPPKLTEMKWLKSYEVRELLNISQGTLQTLRHNGTLSCTRLGNIFLYSYEEIENLLNANRLKKK